MCDINSEGARFTVICKRCKKTFEVIRNFGGGIRCEGIHKSNPAICSCGSRKLELY
jgi:hypothetical protein